MSTLTSKATVLPPDNVDADERRPLLEANRDEENALSANVHDAEKRIWRFVLWVSCSIPVILASVALGLFAKDFITSGDIHFDWQGALKTGINSGLSGATAMALQVITMMPLRTVMNYQYRHGGTTAVEAVLHLYEDGGMMRFYHGFVAALIHGPLSRFGDTASSSGTLFLLESNSYIKSRVPMPVMMMVASVGAAAFRMILTPIDTVKMTLQTLGKGGIATLMSRIQGSGVGTLWHGTAATAGASLLGHYPWFGTYNYLDAHLPLPRTELEKVARLAFMGFVASILSDTLSNSLRVLKAHKQVSETPIGYVDAARAVIATDGWLGLFGRGLKTRLLVNAVQGPMFTVLWNTFQNMFAAPDHGHHHKGDGRGGDSSTRL